MKKDAVLVNGGRGSLIDQKALCRVMDEGHFWGVGLEVTSPEPLPADYPLWDPVQEVQRFLQLKLKPDQLEQIAWKTAHRFLKL